LPSIVSENQTCCIHGRDIADTIASIRDNLEGYIVSINLEKAFDSVNHEDLF